MKYSEIKIIFKGNVSENQRGIYIAEMGDMGCDSFTEEGWHLNCYIQGAELEKNKEVIEDYLKGIDRSSYQITDIEDKNWNEEWEANFSPIVVNGECVVRAPFHEPMGYANEIVIMPRMAFGTGHHETTQLMIEAILSLKLDGANILDMGCGTGVLGIVALLKGASSADAIDIDEWAYDNVLENGELNGVREGISPFWGDASILESGDLRDASYDLILANINRNILIRDMEIYVSHLKSGGMILFSGFLESDISMMCDRANSLNLSHMTTLSKNKWYMLTFIKE